MLPSILSPKAVPIEKTFDTKTKTEGDASGSERETPNGSRKNAKGNGKRSGFGIGVRKLVAGKPESGDALF